MPSKQIDAVGLTVVRAIRKKLSSEQNNDWLERCMGFIESKENSQEDPWDILRQAIVAHGSGRTMHEDMVSLIAAMNRKENGEKVES